MCESASAGLAPARSRDAYYSQIAIADRKPPDGRRKPSIALLRLRDVGRAHVLFAPVLVDASIADEVRTVTFASGMVAHERIIDIDEKRRRVAYSALNVPGGRSRSRSVACWRA